MKVLQINAVYGDGSTGKIVADMHELCMQSGIESHVAYSTTSMNESDIVNGYRIGSALGKKLHAVLCRISGKQAYYSRHATRRLLRHIDRVQPDIVHLHNLHSNFIHLNMLLKYLAERDIATVLTLHDCWFFTGGCFHYTVQGCDGWLRGCTDCPVKEGQAPVPFSRCSARILKDRIQWFSSIPRLTVCGVSDWTANEARRTFFADRSVCTIYNGIDFEVFYPEALSLREQWGVEDKFVVLGPASKWLDPINRDALLRVSEELGEDGVLVLLGYRGGHADLPPNVKALGYVSDKDELRRIYSAADVFANCTRQETLSLINVEAQACGTPVITYRNTGVQETVDGVCGFAVDTGDVDALIEKIQQVRSVGKAALTEQCRAFVKEKFERETNYQQFIALYRKICNEG